MRRFLLCVTIAAVALATSTTSTVNAYATFGKWGKTQVPYYINPQNLYVSTSAALSALQSAASAWSTQSRANIQLVYAGTTTSTSLTLNFKNEVFFRNDSNGWLGAETYFWFDSTGRLADADIVFHEASYLYFTGTSGCHDNGVYIEDSATHEFGHMLGMSHSGVGTATMYASGIMCDQAWRTLEADDIAGIEALYPPVTTSTSPSAPSSLAVSSSASNPSTGLALGWVNTATNADGYRVERSPDGSAFAQVAQLAGNASSFNDNGLSAGATYYYRVNAFNGSGTSGYSNMASARTQSAATAPTAPSNPSPGSGATGLNTSVTLSWSSSGATAYDVYFQGALYASNLTTNSVTVTSLANSAGYTWQVVAKNSTGSTAGPTWSFATQAVALTAPSAPSSPSPAAGATGVGTSVTLRWSSSGATVYDVYFQGALYASNITTPSVTVSSLSNNTVYTWQVVAKNSAGATFGSAWSFTTRSRRGKK